MTRQTIGQLAEWIYAHKKGNAFKENTLDEIISGVQFDVDNNNLLFVLDEHGCFIGVVTFLVDPTNMLFMIRNLLVTKHAALVIFAQHFKEHYNGFTIVANRKDEDIVYNTYRLINHLSNMKYPKGGE